METNSNLKNLSDTIEISGGGKRVDLLLKNARVINTFSGDIHRTHVAVHGGKIVGFGDYKAKQIMDLKGAYLAPGFIDGHVHIESSMVKIPEFARVVLPCGTTSAVIDPHEIANVLGLDGIKYMLSSSLNAVLGVYVMLPSCVPATHLETAGAELTAHDLGLLLNDERVLGIGEMMNYPGVIFRDAEVMEKILIAKNKVIDGHAPMLKDKQLYAYVSAGIKSDHECTDVAEAREKLRAGMYIMIREGTAAKNLKGLLPLVNSENSRKFIFVTDDRHLEDIEKQGHVDYLVRTAIKLGVDPIRAIQMATINTAEYFGLKNLGAIAPGYQADLVVLQDLKGMKISKVFKQGRLVAADRKIVPGVVKQYEGKTRGTINVKWIEHSDFAMKAGGKYARVINVIPDQIVTKMSIEPVKQDGGYVSADPDKDILKIAVIERHMASGRVALGLVKGFGLKKGAIASSVSHDSHNIVVIGTHDGDMYTAAVEVVKMQGGIVAALNSQVLEALPLPVAGLMSDRSSEFVQEKLSRLGVTARMLGSKLSDPFMAMAFLTLPPIPEIRITDRGIIDAVKFKVTELFCKTAPGK
ncbi:MAG: adenine deaminase [Elusimicrobia bacterium RIFOXYA2_FULL_58_8]|nr:MAG: adenine deaminase [Elusimicrobia bacterium RIFOXYA12_FULL_57_11]OGS12736.1 MAG: adenine deaminase [Elusimicrobia bacterium RIFOXYA2_FULL_58_8]